MKGVVVDTNVLLLLIVGSYDSRCISEHRRLGSTYNPSDYDKLIRFLGHFDRLVCVPGALTEISNLISDNNDPVSVGIKQRFMIFVREALEIYTPSAQLVDRAEFFWLGLSDTAQLHAAKEQNFVLLTADGPLLGSDEIRRRGSALQRVLESITVLNCAKSRGNPAFFAHSHKPAFLRICPEITASDGCRPYENTH